MIGRGKRSGLPRRKHLGKNRREKWGLYVLSERGRGFCSTGWRVSCLMVHMDPALLSQLPLVALKAEQVLITEGVPAGRLFFLEDGEVEITRGGMRIALVEEPGAVLGEMSWLLGKAPTATVVAVTECRFRVVERPAEFCVANPEAALAIAQILAKRLDSMAKYLVAIKEQFRDRADHLGMLDEMLEAMLSRHPRDVPRRDAGH
jgi:CRP/FNR family transcriptional regulator, cyclic AMP receptor protein